MITKYFLSIIIILFAILNLVSISYGASPNPIPLDSNQSPWRSVGVLKIPGKLCTATIIGNNELITSAYCFLNKDGSKINDLSQIEFLAGYRDRYYLVKTKIISFVMPKIPYPPQKLSDAGQAWAFVFTRSAIGKYAGKIKVHTSPLTKNFLQGKKIITTGYSNKSNELLASIKCKFYGKTLDYNGSNKQVPAKHIAIILQKCSDYFDSLLGSPVFVIDKDHKVELVGITTGSYEDKIKTKTSNHTTKYINNGQVNIIVPTVFDTKSNRNHSNFNSNEFLQSQIDNMNKQN